MKLGRYPREKLTRFSIRKYHFGAASVAVASLLFFGANSVKAEEALSAHQAGVASSSNPNSGEGDPDNATLEKPVNSVSQASEVGANSTIGSTTTSVGEATKINDEGTPKPQVDKSELSSVVNQVSATISSLQSSSLAENVRTALAQVESAVANAKQVLANPDASKADVEQALSSLQQAVASLEAAKRSEVAPQPAQPEQPAEGNSGEGTSLPKNVAKKPIVENLVTDGKEGTAISEVANPAPATLKPTPARSARGRRGRTTEVQPADSESTTSNGEAGTSNKETVPKQLPTYTNGTDNYKLAEEMRKMVKYLKDNGADAEKVAAIKANYDKLNEKLGLTDENAVLSEADFAAATANLKAARDFTEAFLNKQDENGQPLNEQPTVPGTERSVGDESSRTERAAGQPRYIKRDSSRDSKAHYNVAKEYYYEDGTKGSSPYDKYTYLFHTFTESLVANNANHSPVRDIKRLVYEEVTEVNGGYLWNITFNAAHEDQQDGYAFFSIPKGQRVENSSINVVKTAQNGNEAEVDGSGDLLSRLKMIHPNSTLTGKEIVVRRNGGAEEESLQGLATSSAYAGYYTRRLETANNEIEKSNNMFEKIMSATEGGGKVYRFQLHGRDSYTISFKTINENNTRMDKLYYTAGYRVQQWGRRILAQQWHGRHDYDQDDTDRFPLHVVGNGTFLIKQGKHYNTAYPQGAYGFGGRDFDYAPFRADGILGYDATGAYNSNFDMHQYTAPVGSNQPSSNTKATTAGQQFEFYDKEGNKLSASQIGMHGADKPGLVEYKVKRTFTDKSSDFLNIKFAIQPKTPTFTENIANSRGQTKNLTVSNGTNGYPITLFREYVENGVTKTEKVATVNANSGGNAVFNNVLIKGGKYYAQSIIPTSAYYDYDNRKHTDVHSDKSTLQEVRADGMAPTIQVGESGKPLATTPANNQVTLFVTPSADGKVSLKVQMQDDNLGDGMDAFAKGTNANYAISGTYNSGATTYTADGGVTGANGKKDTIKGDLKIQLNQEGGKYKIPTGGLTVTLNAKDKAGNWTNTASPSKALTVKVLSAVPNEPPVRMLTGNDVQNGAIKTDVKNQVLESVKNANPDLVRAGVKFEYDTTAGNTDKIKVTYPDGQTRLLTLTKGTKPTAPVVVGPQDGTVSITPQGDTDKVTFSYVPTGQTAAQQVIAKKDGNSWAIQGTRPNGITVDSSTGKITITEPTVKDQSNVTATATFLNSDTSDTAQDTAKNPDRQAPEVWMNGKKLTETATDNKFLIYRGATFNPTFRVEDNSGIIANLSVKNIPNGVWFNKVNNKDVPRTLIPNGNYTFSDTVVDQTTPFGTREAIVSVRDANGNAKDYKFQYIIADVMLKNSPTSAATGSKLGDAHRFLATTLNGTTSNDDTYFPGNMTFAWGNNENSETTLPNTSQTVTKQATAIFPTNSRNGATTANGITVYAPEQITKNVTFNVVDNSKPQATLNGQSLGQTATAPIFTVFRGATFNPTIKAWDNSGIIQNISVVQSGLPTGVTATPYSGGRQTGKDGATEAAKYSQTLFSGTVADTQALGEYEVALSVKGSDNNDVSTFRFKYRVVDMELKNTVNMPGVPVPVVTLENNKSVLVANGQNNLDAHNYWKVVDEETKDDKGDSYLPQGMNFTFDHLGANPNGISSNPDDENLTPRPSTRQGLYRGKVKVSFANASGEVTNNNSTTRTVFAPTEIAKDIRFGIVPNAPSLEVGSLYGKATTKPTITVSNVVLKGDGPGKVNTGATRYVALYSTSNPNTPLAEKAVPGNESTVTFSETGTDSERLTRALTAGEQIYAVTRVEHAGSSILSGASTEELVTAPLNLFENSTNRIIQANDQRLNDAEKTGIRIALRNANRGLNLSDENIEISDTGAITVTTADKRRGWLQTNPNKDNGAGFVTRFANIRNDYKFENIEGLKVPGRDTDKGFAWSDNSTGGTTNGNRSLVYYYDATKGQAFNFNDVLKVLNLREGWTVNHTENPSFVATQGVNKSKAEGRQDGFSMGEGNTFLKDGNYINVIDLVDRGSLSGGQAVSNSANKLVQQGKGGGTDTNLQDVTIAEANGLPGFTLNNVVNGEQAIHKAQVYLRPKYVNKSSIAERNGETKDTTTNVVNLYFVPIDPVKPVVERSDSNELGTSADDAPRLTDTSITASSLVKVTDNYDRDDLGTGATTATTGNTATPTTGTTLENEVRKRLNVWIKKGNEEIKVVENGRELTTATGETVLSTRIKTADPATYELLAQASDTSGNTSEKESLGFFKVGYNLVARPLINFLQNEQLSDDDKRTLVQVSEGGQTEELPAGATLDVTFDTSEATKTASGSTPKTAMARVTLPNGATKEIPIVYNVSKTFPMVSKVYDFSGVSRTSGDSLTRYIESTNLPWGMNWTLEKETENENHVKSWERQSDAINVAINNDIHKRQTSAQTSPYAPGEYKYRLSARYPDGRYLNSGNGVTVPELTKLLREGEIVHTVFDVGENATKVETNYGSALTTDQARAAVTKINGSKDLPDGTTYEWVEQNGSALANKTVSEYGDADGYVTRYVKVTLPKTQEAGPNVPAASQEQPSKIVTVKVKVNETVKPTVSIQGGSALSTDARNEAAKFVVFRGATFNPTFTVNDNSGIVKYLKVSGLPSGNDFEKTTETAANENVQISGNSVTVPENATLGTDFIGKVLVRDRAGNEQEYQFKYAVVDAKVINSPKTVESGTNLVVGNHADGTIDSHAYIKVVSSDAADANGNDDFYPPNMKFKWGTKPEGSNAVRELTETTTFNDPGVVTDYYAIARTELGRAGLYSKNNGVKVYFPEKIALPVTFNVKPKAPVVTPKQNGDVTITPVNEPNVNKVEVTYTPADTNRLEDNGDVTKTPQERTTVIATKTDNQWRITKGAKEGIISVNSTTGEITLKDQGVKDQTSVEAKVIAQDIESGVARGDSQNGESTAPVIGANSTLVKVGEEFSLPLGLTDAGVGVDDTNIKVSLPNGETGLTYDSKNQLIRGTISAVAKKEITVRVLDKNGNKAKKTISIAAVQPKPIYAIKDGTIPNVDTPSNFVEVPEGVTLTSVTWKNNDRPSTSAVGTTEKTVTVSLNGSSVDLTIPVTVYPTAEAKKDKFTTLLNKGLPEGEDASSYVHFKNQENRIVNKPTDGVTVEWVTRPSTSVQTDATGNNTKGSVRVTYSVTNADGTVGSVEKIIDINLKVYHATPTITHVTTTFGTDFGGTSNNAQTYFTSNSPRTSSTWKSTSNAIYSEYAAYSRTSERQKANYLGKYKDGIQVFMAGDNDAINWERSEKFDVTFEVKPVTPTVEGATTGAASLTVNNVNSGTTVELYDVTDTTKAPVKIGEKVVNKEGNYDKKDNISVPLTQSLAVGRKIIAKVVYTSGSDRTESDNSNEIVIKHPKPAAPTISQWQNGNAKVTPDSTNSGDKITIPLKSGSVVVTKDAQNGWQVTGQPNGVSVRNGSIEIPRGLVNTTVTATASKGEGDVGAVFNEGTHTLTTHAVTKVDIIKKPTDTIAETDLSRTTGITGVTDNNVNKVYANAGITSVRFANGTPTLTPDSEQNVPVTITYNDGSTETTTVTLKVAPAAPNVTVNAQNNKTGDVTLTIKRHDTSNYPNDSVVTVHGIDGTFKVKDGTITIKNNQLKDTVQTGKVTVTEKTKLPAETSDDKNIPAKLVASATPTFTVGKQDPKTGTVEVTVGGGVSDGAKVTLPGVTGEKTVADGKVVLTNNDLPTTATTGKGSAQEDGKLPTQGTTDIEIPAKLVASATPTGDDHQGLITPSADTNRRPDNATPAEVPATQPAEQPSQTVEVPAQLPNEVSETDPSVSKPQAVLPNTGTKADRATGALGFLSLLGAFGLLFAKKKKDDEEEA